MPRRFFTTGGTSLFNDTLTAIGNSKLLADIGRASTRARAAGALYDRLNKDPGPFSKREFLVSGKNLAGRPGAATLGPGHPDFQGTPLHEPEGNINAGKLAFRSYRYDKPKGEDNPAISPRHTHAHPRYLNSAGEYARPNQFRIKILGGTTSTQSKASTVAAGIDNRAGDFLDVEAINFPSRSLMTNEYATYGPHIKIPYSVLYNDVTMTIRVDDNHWQHDFLLDWLHHDIIDEHYDCKYLFDEVADIKIEQLDGKGGVTYTARLHNAYPIFCTEIPLDMNATDQIEKLNVVFSFSHWSSDAGEITAKTNNPGIIELTPQYPAPPRINHPGIMELTPRYPGQGSMHQPDLS